MAHKFLQEIINLFASGPPAANPATTAARGAEGKDERFRWPGVTAAPEIPAGLQPKAAKIAAPVTP